MHNDELYNWMDMVLDHMQSSLAMVQHPKCIAHGDSQETRTPLRQNS